jgi:glycosyltransferase involved in cell wall biosynthesis
VAVQRFLKISKYLPQYGWEPIIITVANGSYPYYDESLLKQVSPSLRVYRTNTFEPFELYNLLRGKKGKSIPLVAVGGNKKKTFFQKLSEYIRANFFIPDARKGWVSYAVKQAEDILKNEKIDAIITTGPPHSTHLIGLKLKQRHQIKWVADLRDPWTAIFSNRYLPRTQATINKDKELEAKVLQTADHITVISPGMIEQFKHRAKKLTLIYNGFDEDDFGMPEDGASLPADQFIIRYIGNLMASENVPAFWKAVSSFYSTGDKKIKLEFIGRVDQDVQKSIEDAGLGVIANYRDFVDHKTAIQLTRKASMLLLAIPQVEDNKLIMTGKIFEYIASCSEIMPIGPIDGDAADVLQAAERKPMLDYDDYTNMLLRLDEAYEYWLKQGVAFKYSSEKTAVFSRRKQAGLVAELLTGK